MHGTAGVNSLKTLTLDAVRDHTWVCIHYLVPRGDNNVVYKLVPDGYMVNHVGEAELPPGFTDFNSHYFGIENEDPQNWSTSVDPYQIMKDALLWCYMSGAHQLPDYRVYSHGYVATPHGRRFDPEAGLYQWSLFWDFVWQIRRDWPSGWGMAPWLGGIPAD